MPKTEIVIDPSKVQPGTKEALNLRALIDAVVHSRDGTLKLTKTRGMNRDGRQRMKAGYNVGNATVHLENFSLIRFPGSDRYYVIGRELGEGAMGRVKILPIYFKINPDGGLTRHEDPNQEEVIKIIKKAPHKYSTPKDEAIKEAQLAREAGGYTEAVSGVSHKGTGYAKMPKASGTDLEKYLQDHPDITLQERLKMIRMIMEELQKIRERGYFYVDIKPENILYDGKKITFIDWGSAGKKEDMHTTPGTAMFLSATANKSDASQREAYAVAGLIGVLLSDFRTNKQYDQTPVIAPKYNAIPRGARTYHAQEPGREADYDFSKITPGAFNLDEKSQEAKLLNALVDNLKEMGSQDVTKRDKISSGNYKVFMDNLAKLETKSELVWLRNLVNDLVKSFGDSYQKFNEQDPKHKAIQELAQFYIKHDLANSNNLPGHRDEFLKLLGTVIETSADKQTGKIFGSNVLKTIKNNLPRELSDQLPEKQQKQLKEYHSMNIFRMFDSKKPVETREKEQVKKPTHFPRHFTKLNH